MESLYRKYRPQTFADVVGQQHVVSTLEHAIVEGRTSHAYLFCGPRGTGKTTMARLLAKALMCEQGPRSLPDGTCGQCTLIANGEHPDVYELDAASRTGVDSVREEIIGSVSYAPTQGRCKVYIIDEVHMLTTAAFNALLKTLEEPPDHVVFVLCTTDPQKIPATILSRVQRFDFRPIGNDDIERHLAHICEQEGFTYEDAALQTITRNARGGMRDAISTLEQLSVFGGGVVGTEAAQDLLGAVSGSTLGQVMDALARRDVAALFGEVNDLVDAGRDLLQFVRELSARMRDVYVVAVAGAHPAVVADDAELDILRAEAAAFGSTDRIARILGLLGDVSRQMGTAPNQRLVLEIAFTRMARPESDLTIEALAERLQELERRVAQLSSAGVATEAAPAQQPAVAQQPVSAQQPTPAPQPAPAATTQPAPAQQSAPARQQPPASQSPAPARQAQSPARQQAPAPAAQAAPATVPQRPTTRAQAPAQRAQRGSAQGGAITDRSALQRAWRQVVTELMTNIPARGTLLANAVAQSDNGSELVVGLPKGSSFALKMLERPDVRSIVEGATSAVIGRRTLVFREGTDSDLQPMPRQQQSAPAPAPAPQPAPQPVPQAAPQPQPAPAPQPVPQPAPAAQADYPMPWDPSPQDYAADASAYDDYVPYEAYEDGGFVSQPEPSQDSQPAMSAPSPEPQQPVPQPAPQPAAQPAPAPQPQRPAPAPQPAAKPEPEPQPAPAPPASPASDPDDPEALPQIPDELPPDLAASLENVFEVFGSAGVSVSFKSGQQE